VTAERRAGASATFLDPLTVEEVEVVRGPGAVAYGSDAFGGVIRMRSRMPSPGAGTQMRYQLTAGGAGGQRAALAEVTAPGLGGGVLFGGHWRKLEDYDAPGGTVPNSGAELFGGRAAWQLPVAGGVLRLGWRSDLARDVGKPAPEVEMERVFYPEEDSHRFNLGFEHPGPGRWRRLTTTLAWDSYRLVLDKERFDGAGRLRQVAGSEVGSNDYQLRIEGERGLGEARLVVGVDASGRYDLEALNRTTELDGAGSPTTTTEVSVESARRDDMGIFAALSGDKARWGWSAGVRGDWIRAANSGGFFGDDEVTNSDLSGFAALRVGLSPGLELTAQLARGFRDALLSDRYYRGQTGRGFITGNPELEPETSRQLDLALRWRGDRWDLAGFVYLYRISDLIERYRQGDSYFFRNRGEAEIRGLELEGRIVLTDDLWLELGAQLLRGEVVEDGQPTDDVPPPGIFLVLRSNPSRPWWWMVRGAAFARADRPGPNEQEVAGYGVLDAAVGRRISERLELELLGRNLLDRSHLASSDEAAVPAPGRSLQLALRGRL
jgi:iron complex outermembrane receptor protein